jgi:F0F1-type ATP synthase membrane subunit c/vacuolar-type H+-ATPase subunit K
MQNLAGGWITGIILSVGSLLTSLLFLEVGVRFFRLAPELTVIEIEKPYGTFSWSDNPVLRYEPKRGSKGINSEGLRDREFSRAKPAGTKRIAVLGDSIAFGFCNDGAAIPIENVFAKQLEGLLNQGSLRPQVEVINFAVSGYNTVQEAEMLRSKALEFDPDLIIIAVCLNDTWDASAELVAFKARGVEASKIGGPVSIKEALGSTLHGLAFRYSHLFRWLELRLASQFSSEAKNESSEGNDAMLEGFSRIRKDAENIPVLAVIFPLFDGFGSYRHTDVHQGINTKAKSTGFGVLDLLASYQRHSLAGTDLQGVCNREHPNETGHKVAAEEIFRVIQDSGVISSQSESGQKEPRW